jgi:drug/metabolite transporter (DMT)-like permease
MVNNKLTPKTIIFLVIAVMLWGLAFPLIKLTLDIVPPLVIGYFRYFFASLPFLLYLFSKIGIKQTFRDLRANWKVSLALGLTMVTLPNLAQNIGLLFTSSSLAALISTVAPVFTVIIAILFLKESRYLLKIIGLIIALSASLLMVFQTGLEMSGATMFGNILILITAISYGICGVFGKIALRTLSPIKVVSYSMLLGSIILVPISIILKEPLGWFLDLPIEGWWYLIILTLLPCMLATFLWYVVLRAYEVSKQVLFTYLIPIFATVFAYFMLGEVLTLITIFFGILIFVGITLAEFGGSVTKKKNLDNT